MNFRASVRSFIRYIFLVTIEFHLYWCDWVHRITLHGPRSSLDMCGIASGIMMLYRTRDGI